MIIVDGTALSYRSYYALSKADLKTSDGRECGALYGFLNTIISMETKFKNEDIIIIFDSKEPSFRKNIFNSYKENRSKMPDELINQIEALKDGLCKIGYPVIVVDGVEADDVIASLVEKYPDNNIKIVTKDKDIMQLIDERVNLIYPGKRNIWNFYNRDAVFKKFGVYPEQIKDFLTLVGDSSDNIPGVPGIGIKTAAKLLSESTTIKKLISDPLKFTSEKIAEKINNNMSTISMAQELIELKKDIELPDIKEFIKKDSIEAAIFLKDWELDKFAKMLNVDLSVLKDVNESKSFSIDQKYLTIFQEDNSWIINNEIVDKIEFDNIDDKIILTDDMKLLFNNGIRSKIYHDLGTAAYLIDPGYKRYNIKSLMRKYNNKFLSISEISNYIPQLWEKLKNELNELRLYKIYLEVELPLIEIINKMEKKGVLIDCEFLRNMNKNIIDELNNIEEQISEFSENNINLRSPKQISELLFIKLKLPVIKKLKTGYSTDSEVLEKLTKYHPIPEMILKHRMLSKLSSTYLNVLPEMTDNNNRLHCKFNLRDTVTGRFSSSSPNLQNIPIKNKIGREIRKGFIAPRGWKILSADYSQIELRVTAFLSKDKTFIEAFKNDEDIHTRTASELYLVDVSKVDFYMRSIAKTINFGILYGMSAFRLSQELKIPIKQAKEFIENYFNRFSTIKEWQENLVKDAKEKGEVRTFLGRRRIIKGLDSKNKIEKERAVRKVLNTPVQGGAADIIKLAMIKLENELKYKDVNMILQIHDELVFEVKNEFLSEVEKIIKKTMETIVDIKVPLKVSINSGENWFEAH